jgi:hypothetical protein
MTVEPQRATLGGVRLLAEATDYPSLIAGLKMLALQRQHGVSVDGLPKHIGALFDPQSRLHRFPLGDLGLAAAALGVRFQLVENEEAMVKLSGRLVEMKPSAARTRSVPFTVTREFLREIGQRGGVESARRRAIVMREGQARRAQWRASYPRRMAKLGQDERQKRWAAAKQRQRAAKKAMEAHGGNYP